MTISTSKNCSMALRNTLAALYKANGKEVIIILPTLANGSKYIYQIDQGLSDADIGDEATASPSSSQIKLQALVPQQMAFSVGKIGTIIFDRSSLTPASSEHETSSTIAVTGAKTGADLPNCT
ncbi:hypothetical protein N7G274_010687 [Stereocaulon virgatum]|uniref:Uncharacterized protein n=1 Tax=Stereocaulon virgatum TaxID=373712 RepID=A0ABR3ZVE5_9LECA